jgi:hypothetical protein
MRMTNMHTTICCHASVLSRSQSFMRMRIYFSIRKWCHRCGLMRPAWPPGSRHSKTMSMRVWNQRSSSKSTRQVVGKSGLLAPREWMQQWHHQGWQQGAVLVPLLNSNKRLSKSPWWKSRTPLLRLRSIRSQPQLKNHKHKKTHLRLKLLKSRNLKSKRVNRESSLMKMSRASWEQCLIALIKTGPDLWTMKKV